MVPIQTTREEKSYGILVPIADIEDSPLVDFAILVARVENGAIALMSIVEVPETLPLSAVEPSIVLEKRSILDGLVKEARRQGVRVEASVTVSHRVFEPIIQRVVGERIALMIVGWRGERKKGRILGTNIDRFVQSAPCDVVVFKTRGLKERIERVMVLSAPGWHSSYATGYAIILAKKHKASITILSVVKKEREEQRERRYSERLAELCRSHGIPFEKEIQMAKRVEDAVLEASRRHDILVLGASPEWRLKRYAFGDVPDRIAWQVAIPVLMVRKVSRRHI